MLARGLCFADCAANGRVKYNEHADMAAKFVDA